MSRPPHHAYTIDTLRSPTPTPTTTKPSHTLFLNKPQGLSGTGSSLSVNEHGVRGVPPTPSSITGPGLRAHIGHLLPRHAYFRAKIMVHSISSVPFVSGDFGVRWKLKGVQTATSGVYKEKGKDRERENAKGKGRLIDRMFSDKREKDERERTSSASVEGDESAQRPPMVVSHTGQLSVSSRSSASTSSPGGSGIPSPMTVSSSTLTVGVSSSSVSTETLSMPSTTSLPVSTTPSRGITSYLPLKDHSVTWNHLLDPILKFDVDRDSGHVQPNEIKLVVMQRITDGPGASNPQGKNGQNPRLGAVYLNLAEYIGQGKVERRYLLKESKTNATLKIAIEMEWVHGVNYYIPPPLAKGEILTGLAGFLDSTSSKRRPRALDIYGPYKDQEELEIDLMAAPKSAVPFSARPTTPNPSARPRTAGLNGVGGYPKTPLTAARKASNHSHTDEEGTNSEGHDLYEGDTDDAHIHHDSDELLNANSHVHPSLGVAFDVHRLPFAYGTKTTETLIEALFNPVRITEKREESPFTIYEPPESAIYESPQSQSPVSPGAGNIPTARPRIVDAGTPRTAKHGDRAAVGLGLRGAGISKRQDSTATASSVATASTHTSGMTGTSVYSGVTTSSSAVSTRSNTASSSSHGPGGAHSHSNSLGSQSESVYAQSQMNGQSGAPEGRVVVQHRQDSGGEAGPAHSVRGWWKRHKRP
ncbi:hypothetical protein D9619_009957 [Psilocybe cf. subviscida]|uniref:C2 NT-type domain-containing protein n=1 Tax=Psilocybe cf. subviscida TaxID=2480587 RepID=A0A8H5BLT6_9AGAR|nr:hypothetical protein D9619_009957 [Psilocybe cf. subviscida]